MIWFCSGCRRCSYNGLLKKLTPMLKGTAKDPLPTITFVSSLLLYFPIPTTLFSINSLLCLMFMSVTNLAIFTTCLLKSAVPPPSILIWIPSEIFLNENLSGLKCLSMHQGVEHKWYFINTNWSNLLDTIFKILETNTWLFIYKPLLR